ncbi:MAG: TauD/TfdA family dioxygenase [Steroidobacteraceae bacterium]
MTVQPPTPTLFTRPDTLGVAWVDGSVDEFASIWLYDNAPGHRDPHSGQRLVDIADLPDQPRIRSAVVQNGRLHLEWEGSADSTWLDLPWLAAQRGRWSYRPEFDARRWLDGAALGADEFSRASLQDLQSDRRLRSSWLTRLLQDGMAFLGDVPAVDGALLETMRLVGQVAETNYGLVFDVRSVPQPENLAYSDLGLGLHTDNPYRDPVPGFQALHVLIASPDGGESLFADGFALAEHLRTIDPEAFALLARTPVPFHYRSQNAELFAERPLIEVSCRGEVRAVHYNSRSIAPLRLPPLEAAPFYAAYRRFAAVLREPRFQLKTQLPDGEIVVFDNQRILHGRTAFSSKRHERHLRGCYLTRDSVYNNAALLRRELAEGATR